MKNILLILTGGTIASTKSVNGLTPSLTGEEILSFVPSVNAFCKIKSLTLFNIDSTNITPENWGKLGRTIIDNYDLYDGFVICHGTDTMSYTASILSYMIQHSPKPIVITGSQKPIGFENTDAKINLYDSILYACYDDACDVNVVFGGNVIAGTRAKKMRTKAYNAFSSINYPVLAEIFDGKIVEYIKRDKQPYPEFYPNIDNKVGLLYLTPGIDSMLLDSYLTHNDAVIVSGYGSGGLPTGYSYHFDSIIEKWKDKNKTLVMTTQVTREGSDMSIYKVGNDYKDKYGFIDAYDMTPECIVAKLMWILGQTKDKDKIKELFYKTINFDILYKNT